MARMIAVAIAVVCGALALQQAASAESPAPYRHVPAAGDDVRFDGTPGGAKSAWAYFDRGWLEEYLEVMLDARPGLQRRLFFLARRFVAGETVDDAMAAVERLNARRLAASLDYLGEDVKNEREAASATATYIALMERLRAAGAQANVSVK